MNSAKSHLLEPDVHEFQRGGVSVLLGIANE
jgi:hypothetical protein